MADHEESSNQQEGQPPAKKPFEAPRLIVYGDIATLTRTVACAAFGASSCRVVWMDGSISSLWTIARTLTSRLMPPQLNHVR